MFSVGEDVEASALSGRGWSVSAIARHLGRDRKTVRSYLAGERVPGVRRPAAPDPLVPFAAYVAARFADDPHLWASALFDEVVPLGYGRSYVSFARDADAAPCVHVELLRQAWLEKHERRRDQVPFSGEKPNFE